MSSRCLAHGCRFPSTHVTAAHRCGSCGCYGHGQLECGDASLLMDLRTRTHVTDALHIDLWCTHARCVQRATHTLAAHHAEAHESSRQLQCPLCRADVTVPAATTAPEALVYTNADCVVCMARHPVVVFAPCRHAVVCVECVAALCDAWSDRDGAA